MRLVIKHDGASIDGAPRLARAAGTVAAAARARRPASRGTVAVCSAIGGTTDSLVDVARRAARRDTEGTRSAVTAIAEAHRAMARRVLSEEAARARLLSELDSEAGELAALADGLARIGEVTRRSADHILSFGERLAIRVFAHALAAEGAPAVALTGGEAGILTDSDFGEARPLMDTTRHRVARALGPHLESGTVPVIGGFAGADQHGRTTTMGRGGSDYTATLIAAGVGADEVWMVGESGGLSSADPRIVREAAPVASVSYVEAMEMSTFGARQMHPKTFEPLLGTRIRMTMARPAADPAPRAPAARRLDMASATRVGPTSPRTIKCASTLRHNALIDVRGGTMVGEPGTAAGIFGALAREGINIMMISQNPSESSITMVVRRDALDRAVHTLELDHLGGTIKGIDVVPSVAIVALIGSGMRGTVGVAARALGAVSQRRVNILMITQGSSELNLAFAVKESDSAAAVRALHSEFSLGQGGRRR